MHRTQNNPGIQRRPCLTHQSHHKIKTSVFGQKIIPHPPRIHPQGRNQFSSCTPTHASPSRRQAQNPPKNEIKKLSQIQPLTSHTKPFTLPLIHNLFWPVIQRFQIFIYKYYVVKFDIKLDVDLNIPATHTSVI